MTEAHLNSIPDGALTASTCLCLGRTDLLAVTLRAGDRLRSERGTAWITIDGQPQDILLEPGQGHVVPDASVVNLSALGSACVSVRSARPLAWRRVSSQAVPAWAEPTLALLRGWAGASGFYNPSTAAPAAGR